MLPLTDIQELAMDQDYLNRRHADEVARAAAADCAPARIAHQKMARSYAARIAASKRADSTEETVKLR
ncbi:hypothetical protein [Sphingomonas psychrotolerans]|uniref:hypothetical protein n=1 Tax=Sphingomonas psychrotolerans TaxID=1327635 RepID=UPI0013053BFF|nr:hypothetical protein [Sphingomonas psychrotolerans]